MTSRINMNWVQGLTAALATKMGIGAFGLGVTGTVDIITNLDDAFIPVGFYQVNSATLGTFPNGAVTAHVLVERQSGGWCKQTLTYRADASGGRGGQTYIRTRRSSTSVWLPWDRVMYAADLLNTVTLVTDSRALGTTYQNTGSKTIQVSVTVSPAASAIVGLEVSPDGTAWVPIATHSNTDRRTLTTMVPVGFHYRCRATSGTATLGSWAEIT